MVWLHFANAAAAVAGFGIAVVAGLIRLIEDPIATGGGGGANVTAGACGARGAAGSHLEPIVPARSSRRTSTTVSCGTRAGTYDGPVKRVSTAASCQPGTDNCKSHKNEGFNPSHSQLPFGHVSPRLKYDGVFD